MDPLILSLQKLSLKYESNIGSYGSYFTQVWTNKSDLNLALIPHHHKERTNNIDYRVAENVDTLLKDFKREIEVELIHREQIQIANLQLFDDYLMENHEKNQLDKEKNPVILFEYEGIKVNIVFELDKRYTYHVTNHMRNYFIHYAPASAVYYTLEKLMRSFGLINKNSISRFDLFSMIYEYSNIDKSGNCAAFLYKMLSYFLKKKKFAEKFNRQFFEKSLVVETLELIDPFNPHVSLLENKNVTPLLSRFALILHQIEKCETR